MTAFTDAAPGEPFTLSGTEPGFDHLHGIPAAALGEESDRLLTLGHLTDRAVLAVTSAYHRRVLGELIVPTNELADLLTFGTRRTYIQAVRAGSDGDCPWYVNDADPDAPTAQPATFIAIEWLEREDIATPSRCPACTRTSRSTRFTRRPNRTGWSNCHRCRHCAHQWLPPVTELRPDPQPALPQPRPATHDLETSSCTRSA
ncbi:hypothetical protein OTB20_32645 [Streptomyces sp. H27-H1]|uniref:hypothetical protein n=1 Tax=unclassified Streptomyces TaxID=2593676 RepID=UPI00226FCCE7|nr:MULTISPECIES: hypothetical protein [unclassified Streptomyces]MCY0930859.1 hypothetical protein [Streptomyces sp. H27-H1]MDJ0466013.1 hypothetical protein [Streptomyces sp. H27-C3]